MVDLLYDVNEKWDIGWQTGPRRWVRLSAPKYSYVYKYAIPEFRYFKGALVWAQEGKARENKGNLQE
jgi:hypothetical protein